MDVAARYEALVDDLCARHGEVTTGSMFGMPCFKVNGKAGGGLWRGEMVFKLVDADARERALALDGAHAFDPMGGRPMREWVVVPESSAGEWASLAEAAVSGMA